MRNYWIIAAALAGMGFTQAFAEVKTETVTLEQSEAMISDEGKPVDLKITLTDVTAEQAIAEFTKATGVNFVVDQAGNRGGPDFVYDINIQTKSLPEALDQFARAIHRGIYNSGDGLHINPQHQEGFNEMNNMENQVSRPPSVQGMSLSKSIGANNQSAQLSVTLSVYPGRTGMIGGLRVKVLQAIDDQGRDLAVGAPTNENANGRGRQRVRYGMGANAALKMPDPMPTKIATFKAEASFEVPKTFNRVTITEIGDAPIEATVAGIKMTIGPITQEGDNWQIKIRHPSVRNQQERWNLFEEIQSIQFIGPDGERMGIQGRGGNSNDKFTEATGQISWRSENGRMVNFGRRTADSKMPKPVKMVWDTVAETETITTTVEAKDLIVP